MTLLASPPESTHDPAHTMGAVPAEAGPPFLVWAFVDHIRAALGDRSDGSESAAGQEGLALAVGRVVAHEAIHAVATRHPHAPEGLMKASLSSDALLQPELDVGPVCACAAAEGVARLTAGARPKDVTTSCDTRP